MTECIPWRTILIDQRSGENRESTLKIRIVCVFFKDYLVYYFWVMCSANGGWLRRLVRGNPMAVLADILRLDSAFPKS
jgi:hypothetical protein